MVLHGTVPLVLRMLICVLLLVYALHDVSIIYTNHMPQTHVFRMNILVILPIITSHYFQTHMAGGCAPHPS